MDWLDKPIDPTRLILAWQAPDGQKDRRRWAVGELFELSDDTHAFRYFDHDELAKQNSGRDEDQLRVAGFAGYPAFQFALGKTFQRDVLSAFLRRLPPSSRADFAQYEAYFSIRPGSMLPPMTLLGLTEARLPSDGFSLVDPLDPDTAVGESAFEIAGYRYEAGSVTPKVGDHLELRPDPLNEHDPDAVAVYWQSSRIGFVNRLQAPTIGYWLASRTIECSLLRLNGKAGAPRAYARIEVHPNQAGVAA